MKIPPLLRERRWQALIAVIIAIAAYRLWPETTLEPAEAPEPAAVSAITKPVVPQPSETPATAPDTSATPTPVDIFAVRNWEPPPLQTPTGGDLANTPPPPPEAPPLPYHYLGKLDETGQGGVYFLTRGEKILAVKTGDLLDGNYRVGKLEGGQLAFLYLPMKIKQFLSVGSKS